jgi:hypothetical protein
MNDPLYATPPVIILVITFHFSPCSVCREVYFMYERMGVDKYETFRIQFGTLYLINCDISACKYHANSIS